jgi:hypothetical protein
MKNVKNSFLLFVLVCGFSCTSEQKPTPPAVTPEQEALEKLTGAGSTNYVLTGGGTVLRNSKNESQYYEGLQLELKSSGNSKSYTVVNGDLLFESLGTWDFVGSNFDKIRLNGNKPASGTDISYTRTSSELILKFSVALPGARLESTQAVTGNYEIRLKSD